VSAETGILFLNPDTRKDAGCNISLLSLISGLDARFVPIVATPADSPFAERLRERKIEILDYHMSNYWWYPDETHFFRSAAGFTERVRQLAELIRERRIALVHTNAEYAFEGALAAAQTGVPHVWNIRQTFGADLPILRHFPLSPQALGEFMAGFSERIVPNAWPLIATFPANIPPQKFCVIPSGIGLTAPANKAVARAALRKRLGLPLDSRVILTMGRISPEKDLVTFIETARTLVREHQRTNLRFVHFGSAYNAVYFEQLKTSLGDLSDSVIFAGPVDTPLDVIRGADMLLFTSTAFEGLARVCLEALLMEVPVVATRCLGPEEYLLHGETALLASPGDADTLAAHAATLLDNPGYGDALAQNGSALVKAKYDEKRVCAQWMSLYDELALAPSTRPVRHAAAESTINLLSMCGQLGERIAHQERRLRNIERITRIVETPARLGKQLIRTFIPFRGGQN
jgi:glycosyltransferase involved in cell wall biosynthesis